MSSKIYRLVDCCLQWSSLVWRVPPWSPACHSRWAHCPGPAGMATNTCSQARTKKYLLNPTEGSPLRRLIIETIWNMLPTQYIYRPLYSYFKHLLNSWKRDGPDMWSFCARHLVGYRIQHQSWPDIWTDIRLEIWLELRYTWAVVEFCLRFGWLSVNRPRLKAGNPVHP